MMGKKNMNFNIEGYGSFKIRYPKEYNKETVGQAISEAVLQTLNLVAAGPKRPKFHPVLGVSEDQPSDGPTQSS